MQFSFRNIFVLVMVCGFIVSCKESTLSDVSYRPGVIEKTSKDFLIPRELKAQIDRDYVSYIRRKNEKIILEDAALLEDVPRGFLDVQIAFRSSAEGVLSSHTKFSLPRGGGVIDLKPYVKGAKGSFYMKVLAERTSEADKEVEDLHVYFLSEAKKRDISGESFGAGCKKFMDITGLIERANAKTGLQLNAKEQRYVTVAAGVYYFVDFSKKQKIYISAAQITDSRYPELLCE